MPTQPSRPPTAPAAKSEADKPAAGPLGIFAPPSPVLSVADAKEMNTDTAAAEAAVQAAAVTPTAVMPLGPSLNDAQQAEHSLAAEEVSISTCMDISPTASRQDDMSSRPPPDHPPPQQAPAVHHQDSIQALGRPSHICGAEKDQAVYMGQAGHGSRHGEARPLAAGQVVGKTHPQGRAKAEPPRQADPTRQAEPPRQAEPSRQAEASGQHRHPLDQAHSRSPNRKRSRVQEERHQRQEHAQQPRHQVCHQRL